MKSLNVIYRDTKIPKSESIMVKTGNFIFRHLSINIPPATPANIITSIWKVSEE